MRVKHLNEKQILIESNEELQIQPAAGIYSSEATPNSFFSVLYCLFNALKNYNSDNYADMNLNLGKSIAISLCIIDKFCLDKVELFKQVNEDMK